MKKITETDSVRAKGRGSSKSDYSFSVSRIKNRKAKLAIIKDKV